MNRVLVLSPHPDDESLGCGGTLRKHVVEGDSVQVIFLTSGERGGHGRSPDETRQIREKEAENAAGILGYESFEFWQEPNGKLRLTNHIVNRLKLKLTDWKPHIIYVTHDKEMHPEHRIAARLVRRVMANNPSLELIPCVLMYEVWTPLQRIDHIVDISPYIDVKRAAIRAHITQCEVMDFEEAFIGLNRYRGAMHSWPGGDYAEVFKETNLRAK